jgi:hypothetical protein
MTVPPPPDSHPPEPDSDGEHDVHPNFTGRWRLPANPIDHRRGRSGELEDLRDDEWLAESGVDPVPAQAPVVDPRPVVEHPSGPFRPFEPHDDGPWSGGFQGPPGSAAASVIPRQRQPRPTPSIPLRPIAIAAAAVVVLGGLGVWMVNSSGDEAPPAESNPTATVSPEAQARERLRTLLPRGYAPAACEPVATPRGALAKFGCERNGDPGGPPLATYTLVADKAALKTAFEDVIRASTVVVCPGSIQSPGPWRRNATPEKVAGILFCGYQRELPTLAWTNDADLVVSAVRGDEKGPPLDRLYAWWSSHS